MHRPEDRPLQTGNGQRLPTRTQDQYSSEVQQQMHCLTRSASSRCVLASVDKAGRRLLRGVREEEVAGSNPVTPTSVFPSQSQSRNIKSRPNCNTNRTSRYRNARLPRFVGGEWMSIPISVTIRRQAAVPTTFRRHGPG
jgi:hypothetical protein